MIELIALWGFLGGLIWASAGFLSQGRPSRKAIPPVLVIAGFVGVVSAFAVFYFDISLTSLAYWKLALVAVIVGYVGADLLNSLFELMGKHQKPIPKKSEGRGC